MRPCFLFFVSLVFATALGLPTASDRPDVALSASYMPPQFLIQDSGQRERVRKYLKEQSDGGNSSEEYAFKGNSLRLSHGLAERLGREERGEGRTMRGRAQKRMERLFGSGIEIDEPVFLQEYLPENIGFAYEDVPQWPLRNDGTYGSGVAGMDINIAPVWEQFDGDDSLVIAVVDAGFNFMHPTLQDRWYENPGEAGMTQPDDACWTGTPVDKRFNACDDDGNGFVDDWRGWDFVDDNNDPSDYHGHGTQISALLVAPFDAPTGMTGMLPRARILPVRVLSTSGSGYTGDIAEGIRYAARMGAHAINFSIGVGNASGSQTLRSAFAEARDSGVIISAAAGNGSLNLNQRSTQPGSYGFDNVYVVASHGPGGNLSGFSNYGDATVDLAAPGQTIVTADIPPSIPLVQESFESGLSNAWNIFPANGFVIAPDNIVGASSLRWNTGNNARATLTGIDLRERNGGLLTFRVFYQQGSSNDRLRISAIPEGGEEVPLAAITSTDSTRHLVYNLGDVDGTRFDLRFQTCVGSFCSTFGSVASRSVRIDDIQIHYADESPANQNVHVVTGGTSMAAPFFAGYAGLMQIAAARTGIPLTRARMLEGTVTTPGLADRVLTGGRLDVAKGLDFYLQTLPRIEYAETSDTSWEKGADVRYDFAVTNSGGILEGYAFSQVSSPSGSSLDTNGVFQWDSPSTTGDHILRVKAESPPLVLRRMVSFALISPSPIVAATPGVESVLRVGHRAFLLPESAFAREYHMLRVQIIGADGRVRETVQGQLRIPRGTRSTEYHLTGVPGVGMRVWLNGMPLESAQ